METGEKIFSGKVGPWTAEARLVDMKAQMEKSGVSAKTAAKFAGKRHLMLFVTDPATGKPAAGVSGKVAVTGPDKASSSKVTLVVMGEHIGADVGMPTPGKYTFKADIESGGKKGSATFLLHVEVSGAKREGGGTVLRAAPSPAAGSSRVSANLPCPPVR